MKHIVRRTLLVVAGAIGLVAVTAGPAAAAVNHAEPFTAVRESARRGRRG